MKMLNKAWFAGVLLLASAQSHAGWCGWDPGAPRFTATQSVSSNQDYALNITVGGLQHPGVCSFVNGSVYSFEMPYFSDVNATITTPQGWSYTIQDQSGSPLGKVTGFSTVRFFTNDMNQAITTTSTLSGFVFTSKFAAVSSPYFAQYKTDFDTYGSVDEIVVDPSNPDVTIYSYIPGSPLTLTALGNPDPVNLPAAAVPEPSTTGMMVAGLVIVSLAMRRRPRGNFSRVLSMECIG